MVAQRLRDDTSALYGPSGGDVAAQRRTPVLKPLKIVMFTGRPLSHVRQFDFGAVRVAGLQMDGAALERLQQLLEHVVGDLFHETYLKNWIMRSGISTAVSPSGRLSFAKASGSSTTQPCTTQLPRSVL